MTISKDMFKNESKITVGEYYAGIEEEKSRDNIIPGNFEKKR